MIDRAAFVLQRPTQRNDRPSTPRRLRMTTPERVHVVLVHGLFSSPKVWTSFGRLLSEDPDLAERITVQPFGYDSPPVRLRPDRRIADIDEIAIRLDTWLRAKCPKGAPVVLVTHSQGGLVVQRFLARTLWDGRGESLAHIKHIVMYACPNSGSSFFLFLRALLMFWKHPQERELRPLSSGAVLHVQRTLLEKVVGAREISTTECPIPLSAFGGQSDNVVPPVTATHPFPGGIVEGDHFTIVQPRDRDAESYLVLKGILLETLNDRRAAARPPVLVQTSSSPRLEPEAPRNFSIALPLKDGTLHGRERQFIVSSITAAGTGVHILAGPGGSGKSRLAVEIARRAAERGRRTWWVRVNQLSACMREVARELGIPDSQADEAWRGNRSPTDLVWRALNASADPWLIVFDNADDPQRLAPQDGSVEEGTGWLRPTQDKHGLIVVTSRVRGPDVWGHWSQVHQVPLLNDTDGAAMLKEQAGTDAGTTEQARRLSEQLGGLPLALRTAAKYIQSVRESGVSLGTTDIRDFESYGKAWERRFSSPAGTRGSGLDESLGLEKIVDEVYGISLNLLERRGLPQAAPLLKAFACLSVAPIPYRRLLGHQAPSLSPLWTDFSVDRRRAAIMGLQELGLIELDDRRDGFASLHPVVHAILRDDEDVQRRNTDYYGLDVRMLLDAVNGHDPDYPDSWQVWAPIPPHAIEMARAVLRPGGVTSDRSVIDAALELARLTARYLLVVGHLAPARDMLLPVINQCESFGFHADDREILGLRHELGRILLETEKIQEAEREFRAVAIARKALFSDLHHDTLASLHKLGRAILEQGRAPEAETILLKVVEDEKWVRGEEHADTLVVRHTLARAIRLQGRTEDAENHLREILAIRLRRWPSGTPETLHVRETLAYALMEQEKVDEAVSVIDAGLRDAAQPADAHPVMRLRYCRAHASLLKGQIEEAKRSLIELLADQMRVLGDNHKEVQMTRDRLAQVNEAL